MINFFVWTSFMGGVGVCVCVCVGGGGGGEGWGLGLGVGRARVYFPHRKPISQLP